MNQVEILQEREDGIKQFCIYNESIKVIVSNIGCRVMSVYVPDKNELFQDVILGLEKIEDYIKDRAYMGAVIGRVANRIGNAKFTLNEKEYALKANDGVNHLHGGEKGLDKKIFEHQFLENGIRFSYLSPDGAEGYPGNLSLTVEYTIEQNKFNISYYAQCDQDTIVNFTNHMYFNLSGERTSITNHLLQISADKIACVDENCLANGEFLNVKGTPFDFNRLHCIGDHIKDNHVQLKNAGGYDHSFLLNKDSNQIILADEISGRKLIISTTAPTVQLYTGNFLESGCKGKKGVPYSNREGVALETQLMPNSIHIENEPGVILKKGEKFESGTTYCFDLLSR